MARGFGTGTCLRCLQPKPLWDSKGGAQTAEETPGGAGGTGCPAGEAEGRHRTKEGQAGLADIPGEPTRGEEGSRLGKDSEEQGQA